MGVYKGWGCTEKLRQDGVYVLDSSFTYYWKQCGCTRRDSIDWSDRIAATKVESYSCPPFWKGLGEVFSGVSTCYNSPRARRLYFLISPSLELRSQPSLYHPRTFLCKYFSLGPTFFLFRFRVSLITSLRSGSDNVQRGPMFDKVQQDPERSNSVEKGTTFKSS